MSANLWDPDEVTEPAWLSVARGELGVVEISGDKDSPRILEYLATVNLRHEHDETPWCSAFVNWCLVWVGITGTNRGNARSWLSWGLPLLEPLPGAVTVFSRPPNPDHGHVAFYLARKPGEILVRGGNQGNHVCDAWYPESRFLAYRWPSTPVSPSMHPVRPSVAGVHA